MVMVDYIAAYVVLDWPARGRAIARLWRKLPTEEREPYRVRNQKCS